MRRETVTLLCVRVAHRLLPMYRQMYHLALDVHTINAITVSQPLDYSLFKYMLIFTHLHVHPASWLTCPATQSSSTTQSSLYPRADPRIIYEGRLEKGFSNPHSQPYLPNQVSRVRYEGRHLGGMAPFRSDFFFSFAFTLDQRRPLCTKSFRVRKLHVYRGL